MKTTTSVTTDAELFDYLHELFGWGTFDDVVGRERPWFKARGEEIGKVKRSRARRRVSVATLVLTANYCVRRGVYVRNVTGLYRFIYDAEREDRELDRARQAQRTDQLIADAVVEAQAAGNDEWVSKLVRATGPNRQEVADAWRALR